MKKIAVIGAGFSGLAVCWHLSECFPTAKIDLFDEKPIGENTSGSSTGLLHGFIGKKAKKSLYAEEALESVWPLLLAAQKNMSKKIYSDKGIFRIAADEGQEEMLLAHAAVHKELEYLDKKQANKRFFNMINHSGIFIKNALAINPIEYLKGLFLALKSKGVNFSQTKVMQGDLKDYDAEIFCTGHNIDFLEKQLAFKYEKIKGQMLICKWPDDLPLLNFSICGNGHITVFDKICYLGATYEHNYENSNADAKANSIIDKIKTFFPLVEKLEIIGAKAGIRIKRKGHYFPLIANVGNKFVFSCLGSRGLLYHSYLAKKLVLAIKDNNTYHIPKECFIPNG